MVVKGYDTLAGNLNLAFDALDGEQILGSDGLVLDKSKNDNNGTITGATWVQLPTGFWVLSFNINHYVNFGNSLTMKPTDAITIEFWSLWNDIVNENGQVIRGNIAGSYGVYCLRMLNSNLTFYLNNTAGGLTVPAPSAGSFHHIVATYDRNLAADNMKIFIDTELAGSQNYNNALAADANNTYFGTYYSAAYGHRGYMGGCRIYSEYALTREDVISRYDSNRWKYRL